LKIYTLKREQLIKRPRLEVFEFFEEPESLERITPPSVGFEILTPRPILMQAGTVLDYTIRLFGLPVRWTTMITGYNPPHSFSDVALKGPYSFWHHTHTFVEAEGGTMMVDEVRYVLPLGPIGQLVHTLWVNRQLKRIFDYRARVIHELLADSEQRL
jgi:ligand-binding SRPBCC domain-containing protein